MTGVYIGARSQTRYHSTKSRVFFEKMIFQIVVILLYIFDSVICFDVPDEWRELIHHICSDVEKGVFPHPSMNAQGVRNISSRA